MNSMDLFIDSQCKILIPTKKLISNDLPNEIKISIVLE